MPDPQRRSSGGRAALSVFLRWAAALAVLIAVGVVLWTKVIDTDEQSPASPTGRISGREASCTEVGTVALEKGESEVLVCTDSAGHRACWAKIDGSFVDVTQEVRALRSAGNDTPSC